MTKDEIVSLVTNKLVNKNMSSQAVQVLKQSSSNILKKAKENLDSFNNIDSIAKFAQEISQNIVDLGQKYINKSDDIEVLPEGTKFISRDGNITTIIVEQAPQVRNITYIGTNYLISLPYVQFIFYIRNGQFTSRQSDTPAYISTTKKPITNLDSAVYGFPLTNVENHKICIGGMGYDESLSPQRAITINEQIKKYISDFWQSRFNKDLPEGMLEFLSLNNMDMKIWQEETKINPLFILSKNFDFGSSRGRPRTLRSFVLKDNQNGQNIISTKVRQNIIKAAGEIGNSLQKTLSEINLDELNSTKNNSETLQLILKELIVQAYSELWEYLQKQIEEEKKLLLKQRDSYQAKNKEDEEKLKTLVKKISDLAASVKISESGQQRERY